MNATIAAERTTRTFRLTYDGDARRFSETEWLLTNGRGAFAMGTALGLNARRYHGLLVASLLPPVQRVMLLNGLVEAVTIDPGGRQEQTVEISNHKFADGAMHPRGLEHLKRFEKDLAVRWHYQLGEMRLSREVYLFDDRDEIAIRYRIDSAKHAVRLRVHPLVSLRDFHGLLGWVPPDHFQVTSGDNFVQVATQDCNAVLLTKQGRFTTQRDWWHNFHYDRETDRGLEDEENLFTPGYFDLLYEPGDSGELRLDVGTGSDLWRDVEASQSRRATHLGHIRSHIEAQGARDKAVLQIAEATDDFIVLRQVQGEPSTSVLAGYPWFSDWGRDTMICLPGLLQATGRHQEALRTLNTYGKHVRRGLVPNRFDDYGGEPHYNTVDASLWYVHAAALYLHQTDDWDGFTEHALPACLQIVEHYRDGTDFDIGMDPSDKLIFAGNPDTQLTWMDAKRDGVVFTPRHGKAVEINALWHHALAWLAGILRERDPEQAQELAALAEEVAASFRKAFWNEDQGCLYDCLVRENDGWRAVAEIRPNQLFAVSLSNSPLRIAQQRAVVDVCEEHLYTPMGMRTLSPTDPAYKAHFEGDMFARDSAYHQGTVWPWLIGPFVEALLRCEGFTRPARDRAGELIAPLLGELESQCLGQIAEVYDAEPVPLESGDARRRPQGCIAQAWSVAEVLRAALLIRTEPVD